MPLQAEKMTTPEVFAYLRETVFDQGGALSATWRRNAAKDCIDTLEKRLKAKPAEVEVEPLDVGALAELVRLLDVYGQAQIAQALLTDGFRAVKLPDGAEVVAVLDADGVAYDAKTGEQIDLDVAVEAATDDAAGPSATEAPEPEPEPEAKPSGRAK